MEKLCSSACCRQKNANFFTSYSRNPERAIKSTPVICRLWEYRPGCLPVHQLWFEDCRFVAHYLILSWTLQCLIGFCSSAESILENWESCITIHEGAMFHYSKKWFMYRYMNRFMYRVSTLSTQLITKLSKMNRFTVLESQNRLSTSTVTQP